MAFDNLPNDSTMAAMRQAIQNNFTKAANKPIAKSADDSLIIVGVVNGQEQELKIAQAGKDYLNPETGLSKNAAGTIPSLTITGDLTVRDDSTLKNLYADSGTVNGNFKVLNNGIQYFGIVGEICTLGNATAPAIKVNKNGDIDVKNGTLHLYDDVVFHNNDITGTTNINVDGSVTFRSGATVLGVLDTYKLNVDSTLTVEQRTVLKGSVSMNDSQSGSIAAFDSSIGLYKPTYFYNRATSLVNGGLDNSAQFRPVVVTTAIPAPGSIPQGTLVAVI